MSDADKSDLISARAHGRSAERQRNAAERLRDAGLARGEEAAKRVAAKKDEHTAATNEQPSDRP